MSIETIKNRLQAMLRQALRPILVEATHAVLRESIPHMFQESLRRQNSYLGRDSLPHALTIKNHWLTLQSITAPQAFDDIGFSVFSQNNEDGILLYIFSRIGFTSRKSIEIGCNLDNSTIGLPEGNSINLIVNFNFHGLIIDMEQTHMDAVRYFFASCLNTKHFHQAKDTANHQIPGEFYAPVLLTAEVSEGNINALAQDHGFGGEIDLFSLDIDGNDIHVFEAIEAFSPRVIVIEVNNRIPFEADIFAGPLPAFHLDPQTVAFRQSAGSSLTKIVSAITARGYVFVGMNNHLINAFFIRSDAFAGSGLNEAHTSDYLAHPLRPPESREYPPQPEQQT